MKANISTQEIAKEKEPPLAINAPHNPQPTARSFNPRLHKAVHELLSAMYFMDTGSLPRPEAV